MSKFPSVAELRATITRLSGVDDGLTDAERIDLLRGLEDLKNAAAGAQAVLTVDFDRSQRAAAAGRGVLAARRGLGVAEQVALARRESPFRAGQLAGAARVWAEQMPHTLAALRSGVLSEYRASILAVETGCLSAEHRAQVDLELAGPAAVEQLAGMGNARLRAAVRRVAYRLDAEAFVARARKAEADRHVSLRPAPEAMVYLSALLPMAAGVGAYAALRRAADTARSAPGGQPRSRGQLMADLLVDRLTRTPGTSSSAGSSSAGSSGTGSAAAGTGTAAGGSTDEGTGTAGDRTAVQGDGPPGARAVTVQLVMTDRALLGGDAEPAMVPGYGPVPAEVARDVVRRADVVWLRRLLTDPVTGSLTAADPAVRLFPRRLADLLIGRDGICRTPWCDAPVRHTDHLTRHADGGPTSVINGQGLCERCSQAKEAAGWTARATGPPAGPDAIVITTPTGHTYRSRAPAFPGS